LHQKIYTIVYIKYFKSIANKLYDSDAGQNAEQRCLLPGFSAYSAMAAPAL